MAKRADFERIPYMEVVSMDEESARVFVKSAFGIEGALIEDAGLPIRPEKYKPGARKYRVWPRGVEGRVKGR